jgi:FkbM family methyltransferase
MDMHQVPEERHLRKLFDWFKVDCVFDVGANYGQYAKMLRDAVEFKGLVISFEPNPAAVLALRDEAMNDPLWVVEPLALSSSDGIKQFNVMSDSEFSSLGTPRHDEVGLFAQQNRIVDTVNVTTETLETAYRRLQGKYQFKRPFLKLDTQGHDVEIVSRGKSVLPEFVGLQSELAIKSIYMGSVWFRDALQAYQECGFDLSALVPNNAGHFPNLLEIDCIMVRR